jgi:hypothetical protein
LAAVDFFARRDDPIAQPLVVIQGDRTKSHAPQRT